MASGSPLIRAPFPIARSQSHLPQRPRRPSHLISSVAVLLSAAAAAVLAPPASERGLSRRRPQATRLSPRPHRCVLTARRAFGEASAVCLEACVRAPSSRRDAGAGAGCVMAQSTFRSSGVGVSAPVLAASCDLCIAANGKRHLLPLCKRSGLPQPLSALDELYFDYTQGSILTMSFCLLTCSDSPAVLTFMLHCNLHV